MPKRKGSRLNGQANHEHNEQIYQHWKSTGCSLRELARRFGFSSVATVHGIVTRVGKSHEARARLVKRQDGREHSAQSWRAAMRVQAP